jgi:CRP-like cAMP-binding protein
MFINGNDLPTKNNFELYFLLLVNVVSMIVAAAIFGYISEMVVEMGSSGLSPILQQKLDVMNEYMRFKEFDEEFLIIIEEYLNNLWLKQRNIIYDNSFFEDLSFSLHKILLINQWEENYFVQSNLVSTVSKQFFTGMIPMLKPKIFMAKDVIIAEGDISSDVFFNSKYGFCSLQIGGNLIKNLKPFDYFGEIAIFLRMKRRTATVTCLHDSDFLMIESKNFENLLMDFPKDMEKIGKKAKEDLMGSMKLYPASLFAKLVPRNSKQDYLTRKSIYLTEQEEEHIFFATKSETKINLNHFRSNIDQIEIMISDMTNDLYTRRNQLDIINSKDLKATPK